ncbi:MAG: O-antigen ligase family protein [Promethearchaeota archaeon]
MLRKTQIISILLITAILIGIIAAFIGISPIILFGIYGIIVIFPSVFILFNKDLLYGLLIWFLLVLLARTIGKIDLPMYPDVELYRIILVIIILIFLLQISLKKRMTLPITEIETMMILFSIVCLISMIKVGNIYKGGGLELRNFLNGYAIPFSIFFLAKNIVDSEKKIKIIFQFFLILGIYLTFTGIFEHFHLAALVYPRYIMNPNVGIHWGRARGPFVQAAVNGTVLGMIFWASIYLIIYKQEKLSRIFYGIPIAIIPISIFFTYTRACWLGFIFSILIASLFHPKLRKIFLFIFFLVLIIFIFNRPNIMSKSRAVDRIRDSNPIYDRLNLYATSLNMFLDKPLFGIGFDNFKRFSYKYSNKIRGIPYIFIDSQHDTLVSILVELGLVGLIPLLLIFFYIFRYSIQLYRHFHNNSFLGKGLVAIFWAISTVFVINMQFIQMRFFLFANCIFFLFGGIIAGLDQRILLKRT